MVFYGVDDVVLTHEFILNDILRDHEVVQCNLVRTGLEENIDDLCDVFIYNCSDPFRESYFGFSPSYDQVKKAIVKLRPKVVIQLADEWAIEHNEIHNLLANYCNLFLRQHRHGSQIKFYPKNLQAMPLGYLNGYVGDTSIVKPMKDRKYTWSWIGNLKEDRVEMIFKFFSVWNNIVACNGHLNTEEMYSLYSESRFVPCGRGNSSLDCWRLYEATVAGAIPVVVGSEEEIDHTFRFFGKIPPWIYANTWDEAVVKVQEVQFDLDKLQQMQFRNISWWESLLGCVRIKVLDSLEAERVDVSQIDIKDEELRVPSPVSAVSYT